MRIITRSDFDGLSCGAILESLGIVDEWHFVHPKDVQDGLVEASKNDVVVNLPYIEGCGLWFDHHSSEAERLGMNVKFEGFSKKAPSCARVIYEYYGGDAKLGKFAEMIRFVDKVDSADLSVDEILHPTGWVLLGFIADPRTGLGRFRNFTISNFDLMKKIADSIPSKSIGEILELSDVRERVKVYNEQTELFIGMIKTNARTDGNAIILDLRGKEIYAGNRFILYTLYPGQNISITVVDGRRNINCVITAGYSVINKTAEVDIGSLMLKYGGGGHRRAGTCQVAVENSDKVISEIIEAVR